MKFKEVLNYDKKFVKATVIVHDRKSKYSKFFSGFHYEEKEGLLNVTSFTSVEIGKEVFNPMEVAKCEVAK